MTMQDVIPTIIAALPAITVSIVSIWVNSKQKKEDRANAKREKKIDELKGKLDKFYYPYLLLEKENTGLYNIFALKEKESDAEYRTLTYLLNDRKDEYSDNDKNILRMIIENDTALCKLINENGRYVDSESLRDHLSKVAIHYKLMELAYIGKVQEKDKDNVYSKFVYPYEVQSEIEKEVARIESEITKLQLGE